PRARRRETDGGALEDAEGDERRIRPQRARDLRGRRRGNTELLQFDLDRGIVAQDQLERRRIVLTIEVAARENGAEAGAHRRAKSVAAFVRRAVRRVAIKQADAEAAEVGMHANRKREAAKVFLHARAAERPDAGAGID